MRIIAYLLRQRWTHALAAIVIAGSSSAFAGDTAGAVIYTNRGAFYADFPVVSLESFEFGKSFGPSFDGPLDAGTVSNAILTANIQQGVQFDVWTVQMEFFNDFTSGTFGDSTLLKSTSAGDPMVITFPNEDVSEIGFTLYGEGANFVGVTILVNSNATEGDFFQPGEAGTFVGFSFTSKIDNVTINPGGTYAYIDDVVFTPVNRINWHPTRSNFNAAITKTLLLEDFEEATSSSDFGSTIDHTTDNNMFDPCDVYRGVRFGGNGLSMNDAGFAVDGTYGAGSKILRRTSDNDVMGIQFTPSNVTEVAFDTFVEPSQVTAVCTIYDEATNDIFAHSMVATSSMGGFFGASITNGSISYVTIYPRGSFASVDNLAFPGNPDCDGDGMWDDFEKQHFGGATNGIASANNDADPFSNLEEFISLTIPTNSQSLFEVRDFAAFAANRNIMVWGDYHKRRYELQYQVGLNTWSNIAYTWTSAGPYIVLFDHSNATGRNYRVIVEMP